MDSTARAGYYITPKALSYSAHFFILKTLKIMGTIINSIAIICLGVAFIMHLVKFHKPTKFELTIEDLERANKLQNFLEKTRADVRSSDTNSES